ncbi:MAG: cell division protein FtsL [Treponemataceae bacterium]
MKEKIIKFFQRLGIYLITLSIPAFLVVATVQSRHYAKIEDDVTALEDMQTKLIEANKAYVTDISILSSSGRIEKIATEDLGMRKADTKEIIRVSIKEN